MIKLVATAVAAIVIAGSNQPQVPSLDLLRKAMDPNPALQSYTGSARLAATLHVLVPIHETFNGTVYYARPNRKIEFEHVPGPLSQFRDLASSMPTYDRISAEYAITPLTDTGQRSSYSFAPKAGRVKNVTLSIDDSTALVTHVEWVYTNGGRLDFDEAYATVDSFELPSTVNISARFPHYSVDGTLTFANYVVNATIPASVFATATPGT